MTLAVDVALDGTRVPIARARIADIARATLRSEKAKARNALLSITFVDRASISRLNKRHLGHPGATDVISFGFTRAAPTDPVVGDIYICPDVARDNARARDVAVREEIARLVVHGVLHVLGYDHPDGATREESAMWRRQERLVKRVWSRARR